MLSRGKNADLQERIGQSRSVKRHGGMAVMALRTQIERLESVYVLDKTALRIPSFRQKLVRAFEAALPWKTAALASATWIRPFAFYTT